MLCTPRLLYQSGIMVYNTMPFMPYDTSIILRPCDDHLQQQANRQGGRNNQRRNSDSLTRGALADRIGGGAASGRGGTGGMVADQLLQRGRGSGPSGGRGGRGQGGTPPILRKDKNDESKMKREQAGRVTEVFKTPEFEAWLKGRYRGNGAMDMSVSIVVNTSAER